jgi:hypothetical protein
MALAQESEPAVVNDVAVSVVSPAQAVVGHEPVAFSISVENTHPKERVEFSALVVVSGALVGPEAWTTPKATTLTAVVDSDQGRVYRWLGTIDPGKSVVLKGSSFTGTTLGVQPALEVMLVSRNDELHSSRPIELVAGKGQPGGVISLTDIDGDDCDLGEECLLVVTVRSPQMRDFSGGPFEFENCKVFELGSTFTVDVDRVSESVFWLVTRTEGRWGRGCVIATDITMGSRSFRVEYRDPRLTYLPDVQRQRTVTQQ